MVLASLMLTLLALMALMPVVKAVVYYWDGVRFVDGIYIKYPHPDRDYYEISPYSDLSKRGDELYHTQFSRDSSLAMVGLLAVVGAAMGAAIGVMVGGPYGALIGAVTGAVLGLVLTWYANVVFLDEYDCIWWWTSTLFVNWLFENSGWLGILCIASPILAQIDIMNAFLDNGYLRVGSVTFADNIGIGNPAYHLSISAGSGGTTEPSPGSYVYYEETTVEVTAIPYSGYSFDHWILDGGTESGNPINVTMGSDPDLQAYFEEDSSGGGGGDYLFTPDSTCNQT
jgi:hypothetical protein